MRVFKQRSCSIVKLNIFFRQRPWLIVIYRFKSIESLLVFEVSAVVALLMFVVLLTSFSSCSYWYAKCSFRVPPLGHFYTIADFHVLLKACDELHIFNTKLLHEPSKIVIINDKRLSFFT